MPRCIKTHQDSNVRSFMRFVKLYNLESHLLTQVEHETYVKTESSVTRICFDTAKKKPLEGERSTFG